MADAIVAQVAIIITRAEAKANGLSRYFTGTPCKHGHVSARQTSNGVCITCRAGIKKAWEVKNEEKVKEGDQRRTARYRAKHGDLIDERIAEWHKANLEKSRAIRARWRTKNPEVARSLVRKRRARVKSVGGVHTAKEIGELKRRQRNRCAGCKASLRDGYHADHIVPIVLGGSNDILNIQLLCPTCNRRKGGKHPLIWANENGRLL